MWKLGTSLRPKSDFLRLIVRMYARRVVELLSGDAFSCAADFSHGTSPKYFSKNGHVNWTEPHALHGTTHENPTAAWRFATPALNIALERKDRRCVPIVATAFPAEAPLMNSFGSSPSGLVVHYPAHPCIPISARERACASLLNSASHLIIR